MAKATEQARPSQCPQRGVLLRPVALEKREVTCNSRSLEGVYFIIGPHSLPFLPQGVLSCLIFLATEELAVRGQHILMTPRVDTLQLQQVFIFSLTVFLDFNFASSCMLKEVLSDENKSIFREKCFPKDAMSLLTGIPLPL